jgi:hypothetical protein
MTSSEQAIAFIQAYQLEAARRTLRDCRRDGCSTRSTLALIALLEGWMQARAARQAAAPVQVPAAQPALVLDVF